MNLIAPFGFYGAGNIGDESTLQGFARLLGGSPHRMRVWVASQNPVHTARVEPGLQYYPYPGGLYGFKPLWLAHMATAFVFPGGTPIMDGLGDWPLCELVPIVRQAQRLGKVVLFVGTGTERLEGPSSRKLFAEALADAVTCWTVRSARDRERLVSYGVVPDRVTVAADMAWLLPAADSDFGEQTVHLHGLAGRRLIGVNVNAEQALLQREPRLFEKLAAVLDRLIGEHRLHVLFLCNEVRDGETFDKAAAQSVIAHMRQGERAFILPNEYRSPQQMMSIISMCSLTISTRYHFCLFAALQGVPFLAIRRSDKVTDLCEDLDWPWGATPGSIDVEDLVQQSSTLLHDSAQAERLSARVPSMRERAWRNRVGLDNLHARSRWEYRFGS